MSKSLVIWGAADHAKVLAEFIENAGYSIKALFDNQKITKGPLPGIPVYHGKSGFQTWKEKFRNDKYFYLIAIGGNGGKDRLEISSYLKSEGLEPATAVHPTAFIAKDVSLKSGCQILANATICVGSSLGNQTIINTSASVDHDCHFGDGVHIAPNATLCGRVSIGTGTLIGASATILPRINIGQNVIIGAGSVVTKDIPDNAIAYGIPAFIQKKHLNA